MCLNNVLIWKSISFKLAKLLMCQKKKKKVKQSSNKTEKIFQKHKCQGLHNHGRKQNCHFDDNGLQIGTPLFNGQGKFFSTVTKLFIFRTMDLWYGNYRSKVKMTINKTTKLCSKVWRKKSCCEPAINSCLLSGSTQDRIRLVKWK